jgi:5-formyltetrahydrofolate cyclo-ligase
MDPPTEPDLERQKVALRTAVRERRGHLDPTRRSEASEGAVAGLLALPELDRPRKVALYAALPDEVDVTRAGESLRERGATLLLPRVSGDRLALVPVSEDEVVLPGYRSILEPGGSDSEDLSDLDAVVVPGVAFDPEGRRLGRGGGHYDRLLAELPAATARIGVCFEVQVVEEVPIGPHDQPVDVVVSETTVRRVRPDG